MACTHLLRVVAAVVIMTCAWQIQPASCTRVQDLPAYKACRAAAKTELECTGILCVCPRPFCACLRVRAQCTRLTVYVRPAGFSYG